jgi:hypothetical protein
MRKRVNGQQIPPRSCKSVAIQQTCMRAHVLIRDDLPVSQVEVEVIAALLDDWEYGAEDQPK